MEEAEKVLKEEEQTNQKKTLVSKQRQRQIPRRYKREDCRWLECSTHPQKTAAIFSLQYLAYNI